MTPHLKTIVHTANSLKVEFYFSTQNLATDMHMFQSLEGPKNTPVSIHHVCTFKRMRRFKPYSAVVAALRESKDLEVVDDGEYSKPGSEAVRRKEPISVPTKEDDDKNPPSTDDLFYRLKSNSSNNMETSAYVKGFGSEEDAGQIALEKFFRPYGAVMIRKRREDDGTWKGSVFVEFDSEDSRKQFLELDPAPKFNGNELVTMGKKEYIVMKCKEKGIKPDWELTEQEKYEQRKKQREANGHGGDRGGRGGRGGRGQSRGGRGGNERRDSRRDRNRSRSPRRRRDRSASNGSVDGDDWNKRRDRFKSGKDDRASRKEDKKEIERDAHGVPVVKDSRTEAEIAAASNKRKADDGERDGSPKKNKLEIKQDE
jgi:lupus La protein